MSTSPLAPPGFARRARGLCVLLVFAAAALVAGCTDAAVTGGRPAFSGAPGSALAPPGSTVGSAASDRDPNGSAPSTTTTTDTTTTLPGGLGVPVPPSPASRPGTTGATPPGPPAAGTAPVTNTSVRTGTAAATPAPAQAVLFGGITVSNCPPSPTTCEDVLRPVPGTVRAEQLDPPAGRDPMVAGTDTDGYFNLELPPGRWRVSVFSSSTRPCPSRDVALTAGQILTVTFACQNSA